MLVDMLLAVMLKSYACCLQSVVLPLELAFASAGHIQCQSAGIR